MAEKWGSFRLITDLSFSQPIISIRHYFGARIAFLAGWNGVYCKALLGLAPVAITVSLTQWFLWIMGHHDVVRSNGMGFGFAVVLMVWARICVNLWSQEQEFLVSDFNQQEEGGIPIPSYRGVLQPSALDLNSQEKYYPPQYQHMWICLSNCVIFAFCMLVGLCTYMWDHLFEGKLPLFGTVCLAIQIKIFEFLFHTMSVYLNDRENHKYERDYMNSFLWKKFIFYSVNSYYPFFYLVAIQCSRHLGAADCLITLRKRLIVAMSVLTFLQVLQVYIATVIVDIKMWWEARQLRNTKMYAPGNEPVASYEERQAKSAPFKTDEQVEVMLQLVLSLGFVLLFAASVPFACLLCLPLFAVNIRATGVLLLTAVQRPFPHRAMGIGAWQDVIGFLMNVSVLANGFIIVRFGGPFHDAPLLTRCTGVLLFACLCILLWRMVDVLVPKQAEEVNLLIKRRAYVLSKIDRFVHKATHGKGDDSARPDPEKQARWSQLRSRNAKHGMQAVWTATWHDIGLFPGAQKGLLEEAQRNRPEENTEVTPTSPRCTEGLACFPGSPRSQSNSDLRKGSYSAKQIGSFS